MTTKQVIRNFVTRRAAMTLLLAVLTAGQTATISRPTTDMWIHGFHGLNGFSMLLMINMA